ncbi:probable serine/threonine-protein kinase DDB_G0272282 [Galendromus occidentalis]|uniref:Serine/threonine-protein kinase greatwall n=1 Tax=Galendromus occidentalis TaxID=34638 RepID=A0AAJ6QMV8_9ACAR|nr:probable serine/threonine-protein kinase DDB_G0272282 [Galendromus occidentalis]
MPYFTRGRKADVIRKYNEKLATAAEDFLALWEKDDCPRKSVRDFTVTRRLASGAFGVVYGAEHGGIAYAMKVQPKFDSFEIPKKEKRMQWALKNMFVVELFYCYVSHTDVFLFMDLAPYGNLNAMEPFPLSDAKTKLMLSQVVRGLEYIHKCGIIYRDLKPDNVLIFEKGLLKISDFGLSVFKGSCPRDHLGTPQYMAPEMFLRKQYDNAVDWWAFGIMMYELLTESRATPFHPPYTSAADFARCTTDAPPAGLDDPRYTPAAKSMMLQFLVKDPKQRLGSGGCEAVMEHAWFSDINFDTLIVEEEFPHIELPPEREAVEGDFSNFNMERPNEDPEWQAF